jgi:hypothetical protein
MIGSVTSLPQRDLSQYATDVDAFALLSFMTRTPIISCTPLH